MDLLAEHPISVVKTVMVEFAPGADPTAKFDVST